MRYANGVKVILCLLAVHISIILFAAEYKNGELYIEVYLSSGSQISFQSSGLGDHELEISEMDSLITWKTVGKIDISFQNSQAVSYWGVLSRTEPWYEQSEGVLREYFAWQDSTLIIRRENLVFENVTFADEQGAKKYARETGIPEKQVHQIPLINSTVKVKTAGGAEQYFETPLLIHSEMPVSVNSAKLEYSGDFILKTMNGKMTISQFLPLEEYVAGVVPNEIGNNAPPEALKAQAVAARTHAVSLLLYNRHTNDGYDLCNGTHCQVYKGKYLVDSNILDAVRSTSNEVLIADCKIADATYHSDCGGKTDSSENIWHGSPLGHLMGVTCIAEADSFDLSKESDVRKWIDSKPDTRGMSSWEKASASWQKSISRQALASNLGMSNINRIVINKRGFSGRITDMSIFGSGSVRLTSEYKIREAFGSARSSFFYICGNYSSNGNGVVISPPSTITIKGRGSGHGVGLCQVGTLCRARNGEQYRDILFHYYPGTTISTNWMKYE